MPKHQKENEFQNVILILMIIIVLFIIIAFGYYYIRERQKQNTTNNINDTISNDISENTVIEAKEQYSSNTSINENEEIQEDEKDDNEIMQELIIIKTISPRGFSGASNYNLCLYSDKTVYLIIYNGEGYTEKDISSKQLLAENVEDIYYDDTEHSYRLSKLGKIVCLPKMKIIHDAPHSKMNEIVKWKLYYLIRNALDFVKCNFDEKYFKRACFDIPFAFKIAVLLYGKNKKAGLKMIDVGREDAIKGITGLHNIYKPGWKPEK